MVSEVQPGGPADGLLEVGDVITTFNGQMITNPDQLLLQLAATLPRSAVRLAISRNGELTDILLPSTGPAADPAVAAQAPEALDLSLGRGSLVGAVLPGSQAEAAGLARGDLILAAGGTGAPSPAQIRRLLQGLSSGDYVLFTVQRDGRQRVLALGGSPSSDDPAPTR